MLRVPLLVDLAVDEGLEEEWLVVVVTVALACEGAGEVAPARGAVDWPAI
jgi:hypothetical protein